MSTSDKIFVAGVVTAVVGVIAMTSMIGIAFVKIMLTPELTAVARPPIVCDEVIEYPATTENGITRQAGTVCEVFVRPSSVEQVRNTNSVTEEDRI